VRRTDGRTITAAAVTVSSRQIHGRWLKQLTAGSIKVLLLGRTVAAYTAVEEKIFETILHTVANNSELVGRVDAAKDNGILLLVRRIEAGSKLLRLALSGRKESVQAYGHNELQASTDK